MSTQVVDAAVVGGGVIGLATAFRLSQRGLSVAVVDPAPARAATHAAAGMLAPVSEVTYGETALLRLGMESLQRYPGFAAELEQLVGCEVGLRREGTMIVATDAGDRNRLVDLHGFQTGLGLSAAMMTSRECRSLEPMLAPEIRCGLLVTSDHSIDNRRLAAALLGALEGLGVAVIRQPVASVITQAGQVAGVELADGATMRAGVVVIAAGAWSADIAGVPIGSQPAVRPVKGEILRLRSAGSIPLPDHSIRGLVNGREIYLVPRSDGELVVGATVEDAGFDTSVRAGAVRELLRDARAIMPAVDELELVESTAALRPGSPDNAPLIGSTDVDGLFVAAGHYRNGILLAPVTADLMAAVITGTLSQGDRDLLEVVSSRRFEPVGTTA